MPNRNLESPSPAGTRGWKMADYAFITVHSHIRTPLKVMREELIHPSHALTFDVVPSPCIMPYVAFRLTIIVLIFSVFGNLFPTLVMAKLILVKKTIKTSY